MIDPNILTGLMYVGSVFLLGTRWYLGLTISVTKLLLSLKHDKHAIIAFENS